MPMCEISPQDKRALAKRVGDDLFRNYGKKRFYTVKQVKAANQRQEVPLDAGCWLHALFNDWADFERHHRALGESCDYAAMHRDMLASLSERSGAIDVELSWLELPAVDLSALFDFVEL